MKQGGWRIIEKGCSLGSASEWHERSREKNNMNEWQNVIMDKGGGNG